MSSHQTVVFLSNPSTDTTFENGLSVIFLPIQHSNVLALQVWVKTGSIHEGRWLGSGVSHFVEHMVFKGTEKRSYAEIFQEAQQQGAKLNAYTTFDRTVFTYDGGVESFSVGLDLLNDLVLHPTFPEEEWKKEREVILRENAMCQDDPEDRLSELLFAKAFRKHPYRYPVIGVRKIFEQLTREDVQAYWRERYPVNNMTLVIAGNLPQEMVFEQVSRRWGSSRPRSLAPVFVQKEPLQLAERIEHVYGDYQVVRGEIGFRIPGLGHRDGAGLQVLATALGGGDSSVLYQKLREELHWVQEIDASAWMGDQHGLLFIHYACEADRRAPVEQWLREHISELAFQGLSQEVIDKTYRQAFLAELDEIAQYQFLQDLTRLYPNYDKVILTVDGKNSVLQKKWMQHAENIYLLFHAKNLFFGRTASWLQEYPGKANGLIGVGRNEQEVLLAYIRLKELLGDVPELIFDIQKIAP